MEVKFNTEFSSIPRTSGAGPRKTAAAAAATESVALNQSSALNSTLAQLPAVRPEVLERAKTLVSSEHYPPLETVDKIARLLALSLDKIP